MTTKTEAPGILPLLIGDTGNKIVINTIQNVYNTHNVFIDSPISEPADYRDLILLLFNASENDEVVLYINTPGGNLDATLPIIEGLRNTAASVTAVLIGQCHSAGTIIALNCSEICVLESAYMMVHTAQFGVSGSTNNVRLQTDFVVDQINRILISTYAGFLTEEEIEKVKEGKEYWFDNEEIKRRLAAKAEFLAEQNEANESEQ